MTGRLSLETVGWPVRAIAVCVGVYVAATSILPIAAIMHFGLLGLVWAVLAFPWYVYLPPLLLPAFVYWSGPALMVSYIALRLRFGVFGFIAAGAVTGVVLGLLSNVVVSPQHVTIAESALAVGAVGIESITGASSAAVIFRGIGKVLAIAGGLGGAAAWSVMAVGRSMRLALA